MMRNLFHTHMPNALPPETEAAIERIERKDPECAALVRSMGDDVRAELEKTLEKEGNTLGAIAAAEDFPKAKAVLEDLARLQSTEKENIRQRLMAAIEGAASYGQAA